jgi:cell fate regulator YaaT (PSP1 superfamily)
MGKATEYLVSYGTAGALGRFVAANGDAFTRGDRVLVRSDRGQEVGSVVFVGNGHPLTLPLMPVPGELLRRLTSEDEMKLDQITEQGQEAFALARRMATDAAIPVEIVDVETIAEPLTFALHFLKFGPADLRPLVSQLSKRTNAYILLHDLTVPQEKGGCGDGGCGSGGGCGDGGCGSGGGGCSTGGGCGTCSAGSQASFEKEWDAYFAERRTEMEKRRISLPV